MPQLVIRGVQQHKPLFRLPRMQQVPPKAVLPQEESSSLPRHISHQRAGLAPMQMRPFLDIQGRFGYAS